MEDNFLEPFAHIDFDLMAYEGISETEMNRDIFSFIGIFEKCNGNPKDFYKTWLEMKELGFETSDWKARELIFSWLQIPFDKDTLPDKYMDFIRYLCDSSLTLPIRYKSISDWIDHDKQIKGN